MSYSDTEEWVPPTRALLKKKPKKSVQLSRIEAIVKAGGIDLTRKTCVGFMVPAIYDSKKKQLPFCHILKYDIKPFKAKPLLKIPTPSEIVDLVGCDTPEEVCITEGLRDLGFRKMYISGLVALDEVNEAATELTGMTIMGDAVFLK